MHTIVCVYTAFLAYVAVPTKYTPYITHWHNEHEKWLKGTSICTHTIWDGVTNGLQLQMTALIISEVKWEGKEYCSARLYSVYPLTDSFRKKSGNAMGWDKGV